MHGVGKNSVGRGQLDSRQIAAAKASEIENVFGGFYVSHAVAKKTRWQLIDMLDSGGNEDGVPPGRVRSGNFDERILLVVSAAAEGSPAFGYIIALNDLVSGNRLADARREFYGSADVAAAIYSVAPRPGGGRSGRRVGGREIEHGRA